MLREKISQDLKKAMQAKDELRILVLRGINSEIHNKEIEKKGQELKEDDILIVLTTETKKRKDAIEGFKKGNREDLAEKEQKELEILKKYLPEQISEDQIKQEAKKVIKEINAMGAQDTGKVMGVLMNKFKNKTEGNVVSKIVSDLLKGE